MSKQKIQKVYPLTPMQEGMLYHAMLDPNSSSYFTQLELGISGDFDLDLLKRVSMNSYGHMTFCVQPLSISNYKSLVRLYWLNVI